MNRLTFLTLAILSASITAQDKPLPPEEAPNKMTLPKGLSATLFAGEPDVVQPIAFTFDDRGRVWVVECLSYPNWKHDGTGNDRVTMFEDTDGDGKHDVRHVVYDKGSNLSGVELGHGGIWLCSVPNLVFIPCDFNADKPAPTGRPEIVLDGWNIKDTKHNIFNSLKWGPDGWLYGCNGIQSKSFVARPGTPMKDRKEFNCGVWRYHPTRKVFEPFAWGTTNPFGLDFDEYGEAFITNCVIKHLFHVIPGGHFDRMYGQDVNPYVYKLMPSIADYIHWAGGDWTSSRGNKPEHSDFGGGHAHSGCMVYLGDNFPDEYRNSVFTCNIHGNRINRDILKRHGSGYKSERAKDFMFANDSWFRGIAIHYGPDGGVFVSDWCDTGECHNYDKADTSNGRIHKIVYGKVKPWRGDLSKMSDEALVDLLKHKNDWFSQHARRLLIERTAAGKSNNDTLAQLRKATTWTDVRVGLNAAWVRHAIGDTKVGLELAKVTQNPSIKAWGLRMLLDELADGTKLRDWQQINWAFKADKPQHRLALASGLRRIAVHQRFPLAFVLLQQVIPDDLRDTYVPLMAWYAIEPIVGSNANETKQLLQMAQLPILRELIAVKAVATDRSYLDTMLAHAVDSKDTQIARDMLKGILNGLGGERTVPAPAVWREPEIANILLGSRDPIVRSRAMTLAVIFNDEAAIASMKKTAGDAKADTADRTLAVRTLLRRGKPDLLPILQQLLDDKAMRAEAIRGLAAFNDDKTPSLLLKTYPNLSDAEKEDAVQTLASRSEWALTLLDSIEKGTVPRRDVSVFVARQMQGHKDKRVAERLAKVWGKITPPSAQRAALTSKYKSLLKEETLTKADLAKGRQLYIKNCASCHKLYDDGGDIGPPLTGSQRSNIDYILENVIDPSAVVPREYQVSIIDLKSERRVNGIIRAETDKSLEVQTTNERLIIPKDEIEARSASKVSMMPDGLFDKLTEQEVRDLVAYLRGKEQVPLRR